MPPVHRSLRNTYDMYKGNHNKKTPTRPNNAENGAEGNNHSCIFQIIIKCITAQTRTNGTAPLKMDKNKSDKHTTYMWVQE